MEEHKLGKRKNGIKLYLILYNFKQIQMRNNWTMQHNNFIQKYFIINL
jgi:hypothetical protein